MAGRNGNDAFNRFLIAVSLVLLLLSFVLPEALRRVVYPLFLILLVYIYYRMLSRNLYKRRTENERFLRLYGRVMSKLRLLKERWVQRRDYKFFTCPSCKSVMRVPKGHGKIKIVCRKCGNSFTGKS